MKIKAAHLKSLSFILSLFLLAFIAYSAPTRSKQIKLTSSYPATVCPALGGEITSTAALTNSKISRRQIDGRSKKLTVGKSNAISLKSDAVLVEGNPGTALTFAINKWKAVVPCSVSNGEQWFAGGSGALTSKSVLHIINSGFSEASVDIEVFAPNGVLPPSTVSIPQNSTKKISVDSLIPGEEVIMIAVKTKSGRVSSYLFDERKKGLKSLGADFVAPVAAPTKHLTIAAITGLTGKLIDRNNLVNHSMRLLVPGKIDAEVEVIINSKDGNFVPIGLSQFSVASQRVLNIPLTFAPSNQPFSIIINSTQPILASVLTNLTFSKSEEFAWATASDQLTQWSANLIGSKPTLTFSGDRINVLITAVSINGKKIEERISGSNFITWKAPIGLNRLQVVAKGKGISGGVILFPESGSIGSSYIPMNNGANLETAAEPISDAGVITRG